MHCPSCKRADVARSRRHGLIDQVLRLVGRWPYRCHGCKGKFYGTERNIPRPESFSRPPLRPKAQIVVEAETHQQLDSLLIALHEAIASHQTERPRSMAGSRH